MAELSADQGGAVAPEVRLRPAAPSDYQAIVQLLEAAELPTMGVEEALRHFVVADAGGAVVGVAGMEVHGPDAVLRSVAVDGALRGRGLGARMTGRVLQAAREAGLRRVYLLTTTADGYFPRHGFRRIHRDDAPDAVRQSVEFREACPASAVAMALDLELGESPR